MCLRMSEETKTKEEEAIIYHADSSSIVPQTSTYSISYYWEEPLEELSNKDIFPYVKIKG